MKEGVGWLYFERTDIPIKFKGVDYYSYLIIDQFYIKVPILQFKKDIF